MSVLGHRLVEIYKIYLAHPVLLLALGLSWGVYAEESRLDDTAFGLINHIAFDEYSVWMSGENGIYQVHGNLVELFIGERTGITSRISSVLPLNSEDLLITTLGQGVFYYSRKENRFIQLTETQGALCWKGTVTRPEIYVIACEERLYQVRLGQSGYELVATLGNGNKALPILTVSANGGNSGVFVYQGAAAQLWMTSATHDVIERIEIPNTLVTELHVDKKGRIWFTNGLEIFVKVSETSGIQKVVFPDAPEHGHIVGFREIKGALFSYGEHLFSLQVDEATGSAVASHPEIFDTRGIQNIAAFDISKTRGALAYINGKGLTNLNEVPADFLEEMSSQGVVGSITASARINDARTLIAMDGVLYIYNVDHANLEYVHDSGDLVTTLEYLSNGDIVYFGL